MKKRKIGYYLPALLVVFVMLFVAKPVYASSGDDIYENVDEAEAIDVSSGSVVQLGYTEFKAYTFELAKAGVFTISNNEDTWGTIRLYRLNDNDDYESLYEIEWTDYADRDIRLGSGKYLIYITECDSIKFKFKVDNSATTEKEFNDSFSQAEKVDTDIQYTANLTTNEDVDYFKFNLDTQSSVYFQLKAKNENTVVSLYAEDNYKNRKLITQEDTKNSQRAYSDKYRLKAGTYYLVVENPNSYCREEDVQNYTFKVITNAENANSYETESNDTQATANVIKCNRDYSGNIQKYSPADVDYFKFTLDKSSKIKLRLEVDAEDVTSGLFTAQIYKGNTVYSKIDSNSSVVKFGDETVVPKGTYYIKVQRGSTWDSMTDYKIRVVQSPYIQVSKIAVKSSKSKVYSGDAFTVKATVTPSNANNKKVTWSSSDSSVASVSSSGKVKCIKGGKAYIYAKAQDGSGIVGKYKVTVNKNTNTQLSKLTVTKGTLSPKFNAKKLNYTLTLKKSQSSTKIVPKAAGTRATIYINNKKKSSLTVKLKSGASTKVKVTVKSESGSKKTYQITVKRK